MRTVFQVEAERWIVDLIRTYRIDGAKIDSKLGQVYFRSCLELRAAELYHDLKF